MQIHPNAIVHPKAKLADDVVVGPFCVVGEHVTLGKGTRLLSHVTVEGWTEIGERCELHPFVSIGGPPQHLGYKGEPTKVVVGDDNVFREYVTVNRATVQGGGVTSIGHKNFLMAYTHVAHDCRLGNSLDHGERGEPGGPYYDRRPRDHRRLVRHPSICPHRRLCDGRRLLRAGTGPPAFHAGGRGLSSTDVRTQFRRSAPPRLLS